MAAAIGQVAHEAGWHGAWERMEPERNVAASIASFEGDEVRLRAMLNELVGPHQPRRQLIEKLLARAKLDTPSSGRLVMDCIEHLRRGGQP